MSDARLSLAGVTAAYGPRRVLQDVSLKLAAGERVALVGPNGAGKSTLLKVCAGLHPTTGGTVRLDGAPLGRGVGLAAQLANRVVYIAQHPPAAMDLTAGELVLTGLAPSLGAWSDGGEQGRARAAAALDATGTLPLVGRALHTLSGGELKRVLLARALLREPQLLLLDEPLAALDLGAQGQVLQLLALASGRGAAVLVAIHDINLVRRAFDRLVLLDGGLVVADGPPAEVLSAARVAASFGRVEEFGGFFLPSVLLREEAK